MDRFGEIIIRDAEELEKFQWCCSVGNQNWIDLEQKKLPGKLNKSKNFSSVEKKSGSFM